MIPLLSAISADASNEIIATVAVCSGIVGFVAWWTRRSHAEGAAAAAQTQLVERVDRLEGKFDTLAASVTNIEHQVTKNGGRNNPPTLPDKLATVIQQNDQILAALGQPPTRRQDGDPA